MSRATLILPLLFLAVSFQSCQKEPTASFTTSSATFNVGESITFTNTSTDGENYEWNFDDGSTSPVKSPTHSYNTPGTYSVTLTAFSKNGKKSDNATKEISIVVKPDFKADKTNVGAGEIVYFTNLSTGKPTGWSWDFGDGNTSSLQNISHIYSTPGTYTVSLTAINSNGSNTETKVDYITVTTAPIPVTDFIADKTAIIIGGTIYFADLSTNTPTSWSWNFGDAGTSSSQNPSHTYTTAGTYTVSLTATNSYGSSTETKVSYINVSSGGITPDVINHEQDNASKWFGGDDRPSFGPRNVGTGQSITFPYDFFPDSFSVKLSRKFDYSFAPTGNGQPVNLKLFIRTPSGSILDSAITFVNGNFNGGWVTFDLSGSYLYFESNTQWIFTWHVIDGLNNDLTSGSSGDSGAGFSTGGGITGVVYLGNTLNEWANWCGHPWDFCFRLYGKI